MTVHAMNKEALGAADNLEAFGLTEDDLRRKTPKEVISGYLRGISDPDFGLGDCAQALIFLLKDHGYSIVQVVSTGNKPFPPA